MSPVRIITTVIWVSTLVSEVTRRKELKSSVLPLGTVVTERSFSPFISPVYSEIPSGDARASAQSGVSVPDSGMKPLEVIVTSPLASSTISSIMFFLSKPATMLRK